jgi:hypothetical protein
MSRPGQPAQASATGSPIRHQVARRRRWDKRSAAKRSHGGREVGWVYEAAGENSRRRGGLAHGEPIVKLSRLPLLLSFTVVAYMSALSALIFLGCRCFEFRGCCSRRSQSSGRSMGGDGGAEAAYGALPCPQNSQGGRPHNLPDFPRTSCSFLLSPLPKPARCVSCFLFSSALTLWGLFS